MKVFYAPEDLIRFEEEIATLFAGKEIHAPVHLAGGNEQQLIDIFQRFVEPQDWVLCTWRSHYHCLLKGVPPEQLRQAIIDGRSISLCFPEQKVLGSGIVGGTCPIAVGLAMGIKQKREHAVEGNTLGRRKVVCFVGDMAAETGTFHESVKYAINHDLPVLFVVEDNGLSVSTPTLDVWRAGGNEKYQVIWASKVIRYRYTLTRPHVGIGKHVAF